MIDNYDDLRTAQRHMAQLALDLVRRFGPIAAISILAGPVVTIAEQTLGPGGGHKYLAELAAEMRGESESEAPTIN